MGLALVLRELGGRRRWIALGAVLAAVAAVLATYQVHSVVPPKLTPRALEHWTASTQVYVDSPVSSLGDASENLQPLVDISNVLARLMASPALLDQVGRYAHIPGGEIYATGPIEPNLTRFVQEPSEGKRAVQVAGETNPYRLEFDDDDVVPIVSIDSQAPTAAQAVALADGASQALGQYIRTLEAGRDIPLGHQVIIRQLGSPTAASADSGITAKLGALIFVGLLLVWCALILMVDRFRLRWRESAQVAALRREMDDTRELGMGERRELGPNRPRELAMPHGDEDRDHDISIGGRDERDEMLGAAFAARGEGRGEPA